MADWWNGYMHSKEENPKQTSTINPAITVGKWVYHNKESAFIEHPQAIQKGRWEFHWSEWKNKGEK